MADYNRKSDLGLEIDVRAFDFAGLDVPATLEGMAVDVAITVGPPLPGHAAWRARVEADGTAVNARVLGDGRVLVIMDGAKLPPGPLWAEVTLHVPNAMFADGVQSVTASAPLADRLTPYGGTAVPEAGARVAMPVAYLTAWEMARAQGYEGSAEDYAAATAALPGLAAAAETATGQATDAATAASDAASQATDAAAAASGAAAAASNAATFAQTQGDRAEAAIQATEVLLSEADALAYTDRNNNYTVGQTINGTLTVNGDIVQLGESYITEAEHVKTKNAYVTVREGAVGGLGADERAGIEVKAYDGANDGVIEVGADGVARVGDKGDAQPLLTRAEASELQDGDLLVWDATAQKAVPMQAEIVDMEVTYDDDTTETFQVICKRNGSE